MNFQFSASKKGNRRRKLWQGSEGYQCSIIGTCLRRTDIRKLSNKRMFGLSTDMSDFQIHSRLVNQAAQKSLQSRALHKILDNKYRRAINRYGKESSDAAVRELWDVDVQRGAVAGAYWAVMTHANISSSLRAEIYGEVHMLSHDFFVQDMREKQALEDLRHKSSMLEKVLVSERKLYRDEEKRNSVLRRTAEQLQADNIQLIEQNKMLLQELEAVKTGVERTTLKESISRLEDTLYEAGQESARLRGKVDTLKNELSETRILLQTARDTIDGLELENVTLKQEREEFHQEVIAMEMVILLHEAGVSSDCDYCSDHNSDRCPGKNLCGKTILYVGGLKKMVPRYRELVENMGGRFIHHDGGKEASKNQLPKLLHTADAVFCPVACVSHGATNYVKRICKRRQKPFVMMRSSGISSLAKGLKEIVM